ncbi:hypothetical protein [Rheinheimera sp.]|uniref:hypothetical protein n=1 Tax=Rheinheimera sp. TaxID=1869214 RepID=UPI0040479143
MFSSFEYTEQFVNDFIQFVDTGLLALELYDALPVKPTNAANYAEVKKDADLWHLKVKPNFVRMRQNMQDAIVAAQQGNFRVIRAAAGSFRGLNKDMDGIREAFMDFIEPDVKARYFELWTLSHTEGCNIYYTLSDHWDTGEILNTEITGPIDELQLLKYLQPGEKP